MTTYKDTHYSVNDGSTAMLVSETEDTITLVNEDGHQWTTSKAYWVTEEVYFDTTGVTCYHCKAGTDEDGFCNNDECPTNEYTSGEQYMADMYNSDSYINYLNG